jgi:hypothetical protein
MSTTGVGSTSWLNSYDPTDPSSLAGLLNSSPADPSQSSTPAGFDVLQPGSTQSSTTSSDSSSAGLSSYQQALDALTETSDTFLIQSALGQYSSNAGSSDSLSAALQAAEQEQASGQTIDATA